MGRQIVIGGNWKCNGTGNSVESLVRGLNAGKIPSDVEIYVAPIALHLVQVVKSVKSRFHVAAQNCSLTGPGAYTGELACEQLKDSGVNYVIIGHSERRSYYGETDEVVGKKVQVALSKGMKVIACLGETLSERKAGDTLNVCFRQLRAIAQNVSDWNRLIIAYEPVWAIGTGVVATPDQAQEVHQALRGFLRQSYGSTVADSLRIQYGGSVNAKNCDELMTKPDIDGFLVGGASLKAPDFIKICNSRRCPGSKL